MADEPSVNDLSEMVDRLLREQRPDRYEPGGDWLNSVIDSIPDNAIPDSVVRQFALRQFVNGREAQATKRANRLLRKIGETGQLALDWWHEANEPISIETELVDDDGNVRRLKERVSLRAATSDDLRAFDRGEHDRAERDHKSRLMACDGARFAAESMDSSGRRRFDEWAESELPQDGTA